ncbi:MAG: enoyl-CoA hydratase/isomerase family protein [Burkholderiales bacterium]|nr:enoyl-CoA hydratase/isomerase family protein [Burkholderiales bacterium]MDE1927128.1 enoyl-CoA hydratase/isomerase family protein [Burkholderiales bacterium]MDE2158963.1 enoyl-CoA hydratase/isomerase family protein [Burkholderiales bacterium]MDE2503640.1 enoyl-CoA hydratase/isomerase family protein [Burkholderiales bacterium]
MHPNPVIRLEVDADQIATLTIDYPGKSMNVIDQAFLDDLHAGIDRVAADPGIRGAIITSGKAAFVAGADLVTMEANLDRMQDDPVDVALHKYGALSRAVRRIETCGKPVVAAINGTAMGGGYEICLGCHRRVMSTAAGVVVGLPEVQVGLLPGGGGTQRLPRMIGVQAAMPWLMEGKSAAAAEALQAGLVDAVAAPEELLAEARRWLLGEPVARQPWDVKGYKIPGGGPLDPRVAPAFVVGNTMLMARTHGKLPAPLAIQSCLFEGLQLPIDKALRIESKYLLDTAMNSPVSRSMIRTLFVNKTKAEKGLHRPAGFERSECRRLGIVGAGMMGAGIALHAAQRRIEVVLIDRDAAAAERGRDHAVRALARQVEKGRLTREAADAVLSRITASADYAALRDADLVVEAVFEDRAVKAEVTRRIDAVVGPDCVVATNTSALPITLLAEASAHPERYIGLHFFSPAERMPLVEVIRGRRTSDATLARALDLVGQLKRTPIVVNDARGFYTSRFIGSFIDDAIGMVAEGIAPALIENCARHVGMPVGPLAITDELSIELSVHAGEAQRKEFPESYREGRSVPVLRRLYELGRLGKKVGRGFYDHGEGGKRLWPGLAELYPLRAEQPDARDLELRILHVQALEAVHALAEGVLTDPADGDLGAILGVGFPAYTGGPFCYIDGVGVAAFVATSDRLAQRWGEHLRAPALLREMAANGRTFYGPGARV